MTNLMAAIMVLVQTNWASIGTFTDTKGASFDVQQARLVTNTVAIIEFENKKHEFTLKSAEGPVVDEKKIQRHLGGSVTNWFWPGFNWYTNYNTIDVTNIIIPCGRITNETRQIGWGTQNAD